MNKVKKVVNKRFTVYDSEANTAIELLNELGSLTNEVCDELVNKTDLYGDHKGSWQGLSKPTLAEEGLRATVEGIIENKIPTIESSLEQKANKSDVDAISASLDNMENEKATKQEVDIERQRINNLTTLEDGSTTGDAELKDGRIDDLGVTHANIGTAIRTRIGYINNKVNTLSENILEQSINLADISIDTMIPDHEIKAATGELVSSANWSASDYIDIEPNTEYSFIFYFEEKNQYIRQSNVYYGLYDTNKAFIKGGNTGSQNNPITINSGNATKIRMSCTTMRVKSGYIMLIKTSDESKFLGKDKTAYVKGGAVLSGLLKEEFNKIEEELKNNKGSGFTPKIILPSEFYAVVGHELSIYNENVILCDDLNKYDVDWHINQGNFYDQYKECFRITPTKGKEGNYSVRLRVLDKYTRTILAEKTMIMHIVSEKYYTNKKVLFIGDSRTSAGYYPYEIQNVLSSGGITSLGTETTTPWIDNVQKPINHEGRGAWSAKDYVATTSKNGYTNPFINPSTNKFDFSYYMKQQGYSSVDIVFINLGTNGMNSNMLDESIQANIDAMDEMIASIRKYNSNVPIVIELVTPPATQDGWTYSNHGGSVWEMMFNIFRNNEMVIEHYTNKNVYLAPTIFNLDRNNDYGSKTMPLSARNSKEIIRQTNNLHPSDIGYYKMADVFWSIINAVM